SPRPLASALRHPLCQKCRRRTAQNATSRGCALGEVLYLLHFCHELVQSWRGRGAARPSSVVRTVLVPEKPDATPVTRFRPSLEGWHTGMITRAPRRVTARG